ALVVRLARLADVARPFAHADAPGRHAGEPLRARVVVVGARDRQEAASGALVARRDAHVLEAVAEVGRLALESSGSARVAALPCGYAHRIDRVAVRAVAALVRVDVARVASVLRELAVPDLLGDDVHAREAGDALLAARALAGDVAQVAAPPDATARDEREA